MLDEPWQLSDATVVLESESGTQARLFHRQREGSHLADHDGVLALRVLDAGLTPRQAALLLSTTTGTDSDTCLTRLSEFVTLLHGMEFLAPGPRRHQRRNIRRTTANPPLTRIFLEVTRDCNLACVHCYAQAGAVTLPLSLAPRAAVAGGGDAGSPPPTLPTPLVLALIEQAADLGVLEFDVTGGEPLVRDDLPEILDALDRAGMLVNLYTNGTLLTEEWIERLRKHPLVSLIVSLDSVEPAVHDRFRGCPGAWQRTVDGVRRARQAGMLVRINVSVAEETIDSACATAEFARQELGARSVMLAPLFPVGRAAQRGGNRLPMERIVQVLCDGQGERTLQCQGPIPPGTELPSPPCGVARWMLFVSSAGIVTLCPTLGPEQIAALHFGSLAEHSLRDLWEAGVAQSPWFRVQCRELADCEYGVTCGGGCRSRAFLEHGAVDAPDDVACRFYAELHRRQQAEAAACDTLPSN